MDKLLLHDFHQNLRAEFTSVNGAQAVGHYGNWLREYEFLSKSAGVLDFSFRGRICLTGADRVRYLHGQVTNDIKALAQGSGGYAAVVNAKGRMEADVNIYHLEEELLLDFEPGLTGPLSARLEKYIVADDVQVVDVAVLYGLLTVQGPKAGAVIRRVPELREFPARQFQVAKVADAALGDLYVVNQPRLGTLGYDLFVPAAAMPGLAEELISAARSEDGGAAGWQAFETARIEAGIPRFNADMDETNFPQECGIEARAVSYTKGCYIGQEVLNRIHTMGHVNRTLRQLQLQGETLDAPAKNDKIIKGGKEVGYITSAARSPKLGAIIALGYVWKEAKASGTELVVRSGSREMGAKVIHSPFQQSSESRL
jgi:folate-binding protein YgfZ